MLLYIRNDGCQHFAQKFSAISKAYLHNQ